MKLQLGCQPVAAVQYTFTHKQHTEQHKTNSTQNNTKQTAHRTTQNKQYTEQHKTNSTQNNTKQTVHRTQKFWEDCGPCPTFAGSTLASALQLRKKQGKTSVRVAEECQDGMMKIHKHTKRVQRHNNKNT